MISRFTAKGWCVVPRPKSQIISALFFTTYDFAVLKMGMKRRTPNLRSLARRQRWMIWLVGASMLSQFLVFLPWGQFHPEKW
jgi:hypothetical protein